MDKDIIKRNGFIAALDQSGGSTIKALSNYGINKDRYHSNEEMDELIHKMRKRIITNKYFTKEKIIGTILFENEINKKIENKYTVDYLLENKEIITFVKIDIGLQEKHKGVQLMKEIPNLEKKLEELKKHNVFGTKERSVIYENNKEGIKEIVSQQFALAKLIYKKGLIPIVEPEVDINAKDKDACEITLKQEIDKELNKLNDEKIILKLSLPTQENLYKDYIRHKNILKVVALSGGYNRKTACELLSKNEGVIASFSRTLLEGLKESQKEDEFDDKLKSIIDEIYKASVK